MSQTFECGDNTALVGYLYGECEIAEREAIGAHVTVCAACAAELAALESTRIHLASWTPPEAELGFAVGRPQASEPRVRQAAVLKPAGAWGFAPASWTGRPMPGWAQVAAAAAIFAAGLGLGIVRGTLPVGAPGGTRAVTAVAATAATTAATAIATIAASGPGASTSGISTADLTALEQRLRQEIAQIRRAAPVREAAGPVSPSEAQLLARVRALIDESEQRQQRELALRTAQVVRDFDSQRRVDLAQIQQSFGQIEGLTGAEVREQRQMLNYLMRVSQQP